MATCEGSSPFSPTTKNYESYNSKKKGLSKDLKIFVIKTIASYGREVFSSQNIIKGLDEQSSKDVLKRQFGKEIFGDVLDKV